MSAADAPTLEQCIDWSHGFRSETDKTVLKALARWYAWRPDGTNVRPRSIGELSMRSRVPKRSVERSLARLVDGGWLQVTRPGRGRRSPSTYRICVERLATADPERLALITYNRQSGGCQDRSTAKMAVVDEINRQSGGCGPPGAPEIAPNFEKVAVVRGTNQDLYSGTEDQVRGTHTPAGEIFRHPNHAYCGARFCVPQFLDDQFAQQAAWSRAELQAHYRTLNARALETNERIGDALKWLRAWFAEAVRAQQSPPPQQLAFGPMESAPLSRREIDEAQAIRNRVYGGCPHDPRHPDWRECVRAIALARRVS